MRALAARRLLRAAAASLQRRGCSASAEVWLRAAPPGAVAPPPGTADVLVGLTPALLDALGDVTAVEVAPPGPVTPPAPLARLSWSALTRSASDELYHATWGHAAGVRDVVLPLAATLIERGAAPRPAELDETTVLARLRVDAAELERWRARAG